MKMAVFKVIESSGFFVVVNKTNLTRLTTQKHFLPPSSKPQFFLNLKTLEEITSNVTCFQILNIHCRHHQLYSSGKLISLYIHPDATVLDQYSTEE